MSGWGNEDSGAGGGGGGWGGGITAPTSGGPDAGAPPARELGLEDSKHAPENGNGGGASDGGCRICKQDGHFARDCPDKPAGGMGGGGCFNCGEEGHMKSDCPQPAKFTGECRHCGKEGHPARECPDKPPEKCRNCNGEGHIAKECTNARFIDKSHIKEMTQEQAWDLMVKANGEADFDEFKEHMLEYMKATPGMKMSDMEDSLRSSNLRYYLYALSFDDLPYDKVIVGPNGEMGEEWKYVWSLNKCARPRRNKTTGARMAATPAENLARLIFAGTVEDEMAPFCHSCKNKGHLKRECEAGEMVDEFERVVLKCTNCESLDHRLRDCPNPRKPEYNPNLCRNCNEEGHKASDCEKPRVADENTQCRKCEKMGHFSKDCPDAPKQTCFNCYQEGHRSSDCTNERVMKCRNCDEIGHAAKECPKPRDITRVKCNKCDQMGHYASKCTNPPKEVEKDDAYGGGGDAYGGGDNGGDNGPTTGAPAWSGAAPAAGGAASWAGGGSEAITATGGW